MMMMKMNTEKMNINMLITLTRKEMVMKMEKMNMPPRPYKWRVLLPLLQGHCEVGNVPSFCHEEHGLYRVGKKNFLDSKIFVAKNFRIKRANSVNF